MRNKIIIVVSVVLICITIVVLVLTKSSESGSGYTSDSAVATEPAIQFEQSDDIPEFIANSSQYKSFVDKYGSKDWDVRKVDDTYYELTAITDAYYYLCTYYVDYEEVTFFVYTLDNQTTPVDMIE